MSALESGKWLNVSAIAETTAAACVIPAAWPLVLMMGLSYSDPGAMDTASQGWKDIAGQLDTMKQEIIQLRDGVPPESWTSEDREAFARAVQKYDEELGDASSFVDSVGAILQYLSYGYFALSVLSFGIAQILATQAAAIVAAMVFPPAAAALEVAANATAGAFNAIMGASQLSLRTALTLAGGIIGTGMAAYLVATSRQPGGPAGVEFTQAVINTSGGAAPARPATF